MTRQTQVVPAHRSRSVQLFGFMFGSAVMAVCLWYLLAYLSDNGAKVLDDSYITYTYARNLAEGYGFRYNPADLNPTEGGTSFSHMLVAAAGIKMGFDPLTTTRVVSLAIFFAALIALSRAISIIARTGIGLGIAAGSAAGALLVLLPETAGHFTKGLETIGFLGLHIGLVTWALLALYRAPTFSISSVITGATLAALLGITRPEGILIAAAILGLTTLLAAFSAGRFRPAAAATPFFAGVAFTLAIGAFLLWKISYFGDALPNAYWVKSHNKIFGNGGVALPGLSEVAWFMLLRFVPLAVAVIALFALSGARIRPYLPYAALGLPGLAIALLYAKAIHEVAGGFRYGFPMLAPLVVLFGLGLVLVLRRYPQAALVSCTIGLMGISTVGSTRDADPLSWAQRPAARATAWIGMEPAEGPLERLALDLRDTGLGSNGTIYLSAAGFVPYISRFHAIDWIGLNNNTLSGANEMSLDEVWAYVETTRPDVIQSVVPPATEGITRREEDPAFNSPAVKDLLRGRVKLFYYWDREIVAEMLWREMLWIRDNARFAACYELRGTWTLFAYVRNSSPHADHIADTFATSERNGCDMDKTRADYQADPFTGDNGQIALR